MKRRRNLIVALLLVCAMAIGVGYAALTQELKITSSATLNKDDSSLLVQFVDGSAKVSEQKVIGDTTGSGAATAKIEGSLHASYDISGLKQAGDYVIMEYVIENKTPDASAVLSKVSSTAGTIYFGDGTSNPGTADDLAAYFSKEVKLIKNSATVLEYRGTSTGTVLEGTNLESAVAGGELVLNPNDTVTVQVKVTLNKTIGLDDAIKTVGDGRVSLEGAVVYFNFASRPYTP